MSTIKRKHKSTKKQKLKNKTMKQAIACTIFALVAIFCYCSFSQSDNFILTTQVNTILFKWIAPAGMLGVVWFLIKYRDRMSGNLKRRYQVRGYGPKRTNLMLWFSRLSFFILPWLFAFMSSETIGYAINHLAKTHYTEEVIINSIHCSLGTAHHGPTMDIYLRFIDDPEEHMLEFPHDYCDAHPEINKTKHQHALISGRKNALGRIVETIQFT